MHAALHQLSTAVSSPPAPAFPLAAAPARPKATVAVAAGDGIGPEITAATLRVLRAAGAALDLVPVELGGSGYDAGHSAGIAPAAFDAIRRAGVLLKGPVSTPQGGGFKSVNVTIRKALGLFANVRPAATYHPFVATRHPGMDVVIVRENEEDLYAGIEHRHTDQVVQCLKLITRPGCERIVRYAFEYAARTGRRKVSCFTKDNIMKMTDGLFHRVFDEVAREYPGIEADHWIVDIGAARLAADPTRFDVIVTPNLYGDILSDVAAEVAGGVGLAPSANVGERVAMFEAIHGSAPALAGRDAANPSGLLLAGVMMLAHVGQGDVAERVHNAWLATIEDGVHTPDVFADGSSRRRAGTRAFADAVIERLGRAPRHLRPAAYAGAGAAAAPIRVTVRDRPPAVKELVGVDVFLQWTGGTASGLAAALSAALADDAPPAAALRLQMITNRGVKVWPDGLPETYCTDHWRCRFKPAGAGRTVAAGTVVGLIWSLVNAGFDVVKTENLYDFDGQPGYALGQGQ